MGVDGTTTADSYGMTTKKSGSGEKTGFKGGGGECGGLGFGGRLR